MYLTLLNENQKKTFLTLALLLSNADGSFDKSEEDLLKLYCEEMCINYDTSSYNNSTEDDICKTVQNNFDEKTIKMALFELTGLALVDNDYDDTERKLLLKIANLFSYDEKILKEYESYVTDYMSLQKKINNSVIGA